MTLTPREAYRRLIRTNPDFNVEGGVDYNKDYYVFSGGLDTYAAHKRTGNVTSFSIPFHLKDYFDAVKKRPIAVESLL